MSASERDWLLADKGLAAVYDVEAPPVKPAVKNQKETGLNGSQEGSVNLIGEAFVCDGTEIRLCGDSAPEKTDMESHEYYDSKSNGQEEQEWGESEQDGDSQGGTFEGIKWNARTLSLLPGDVAQEIAVEQEESFHVYHFLSSQGSVEGGETVSLTDSYDSDSLREVSDEDELSKAKKRDTEAAGTVESGEDLGKKILKSDGHAVDPGGSTARPILAYVLLATSIMALSSIGPLVALQQASTMMKILWRNAATTVVLFPFAALNVRCNGMPTLSLCQWAILWVAAGCLSASSACFAMALEYTTVGNAVVFSNMSSLLFLFGKLVAGERTTLLEGIGALVAFVGAVFCSRDSGQSGSGNDTASAEPSGLMSYFGDFLAFLATVTFVLYMVCAKKVRTSMSLSVFMFFIVFFGTLECIVVLVATGSTFLWGMDVDYGLFGWLSLRFDRLPVELIVVIVCNVLGLMGYVQCMPYFNNLVLSAATLMESVVAECIALLLGVGTLPGWQGWLGNALVTGGTLAVIYQPVERQPGGKNEK